MSSAPRPRVAIAWASGCGGCEMAFLDLGERLLELDRLFEIVYFPLLSDGRRSDLEALPDDSLDLALVSGAMRTSEDVALARLLRRVSRRVVALGACAQLGAVLALADLVPLAELLDTVYGHGAAGKAPGGPVAAPTGVVDVATLTPTVRPLAGVVPVDGAIPGCPPERDTLGLALQRLAEAVSGGNGAGGHELPSNLGSTSVCEDCRRKRPEKAVSRFARAHMVDPDAERCLLDQGLVCVGPATVGGCGAPCPAAGAGCRGCYGPQPGVADHGARVAAALAAALAAGEPGDEDESVRTAVTNAVEALPDPVGTLYRYTFAGSLLARLARPRGGPPCDD